VVSAGALGAVVWWALRQDAPSLPSSGRGVVDLVAALGVYAAASVARAERWHRILARAALPVERADAYRLTAVGYMGNNVLPARAGDLLRIVVLGPLAAVSRRRVLGTVVAERLLDAVALAVVFAVAVVFALRDPVSSGDVVIVVVIGAVVGAGAVCCALVLRWSRRAARVRAFLAPVADASRNLASAHGVALLALSVVIWMLEAAVYLLVGRSVGIDLGAAGALYVVALTNLSALIPAAPGYVGTFDAAVLLALRSLRWSGGAAVGYLLLLRFVLFVPITVVGLAFFVVRYSTRTRLRPLLRRP
jgi:uncharacterized protein (TIRG00374 family)